MKESAPARIITTASEAHQGAQIPFDDLNAGRSYRGFTRYKQIKLANILFTRELARQLDEGGAAANWFHPGPVASGFNRNNGFLMSLAMSMLAPLSRSPEDGAETAVRLATSPVVATASGGYYVDKQWRAPSADAQDIESGRRLWQVSEAQCS